MKKILIIHKTQFGYHTDYYKWCEFLRDKYNIHVVCFDSRLPRIVMDGIKVHYVTSIGFKQLRGLFFLFFSVFYAARIKGNIIVSYFYGCNFIKLFLPYKKILLDIRTFSVNPDERAREKEDLELFSSIKLYDYVTVISEGLRRKMPKEDRLTSVLPLGAEIVVCQNKVYDSINLLYVGTLHNRDLEKTIIGFFYAKEKLKDKIQLSYSIVGSGYNEEEIKLRNLVSDLGMTEYVTLYGYQPHNKLAMFYNKCNVGVSFIPITDYYQYQPPTKTFEYVMAGLFTIATATQSNKEIISEINGLTIIDSPDAFADAIVTVYDKRSTINSYEISHSLEEYRWDNIVNKYLVNILNRFESIS